MRYINVRFTYLLYLLTHVLCMFIVVVRVDEKPIRLQLCDTTGQVGFSVPVI